MKLPIQNVGFPFVAVKAFPLSLGCARYAVQSHLPHKLPYQCCASSITTLVKHRTNFLAPVCLSAFLKDFLNCHPQFFPMLGIGTVIPFVPLDVVVKGSPWNVQRFAEYMDVELTMEQFQGGEFFLCGRIGNTGNGFQHRNDLLLLFAAAKEGVKSFRRNCLVTISSLNGTIGMNPTINCTSGDRVLLTDI